VYRIFYLSVSFRWISEVAYVGNLMPDHFPVSKLLLENGKSVVCEKSLCMNEKEVKVLIDVSIFAFDFHVSLLTMYSTTAHFSQLAKKKNLFFMEAVWSRFFPVYAHVKEQIKLGAIGDVVQVNANFGVPISQHNRIR